ncbi:MAG: hypothetical protein NC429_14045 [Lachnospiraceae bacterium]|nr:hypothetical protein [Lachnospiraceae bacterium]
MRDTEVCVFAGIMGPTEYSLLEKYAGQGCGIAIMDRNKDLGRRIKAELENSYHVKVFFFHGDRNDEEDRDIFLAAVSEMYGNTNCIICNNN